MKKEDYHDFSLMYKGWIIKILMIKYKERFKKGEQILWKQKGKLKEQARNKYKELPNKEKDKKRIWKK